MEEERSPSRFNVKDVYAEDKLAGLYFLAPEFSYWFRVEPRAIPNQRPEFEFNYPLDKKEHYAVIEPETNYLVGICRSSGGMTTVGPPPEPYKVYLLRPLLPDVAAKWNRG